MSSQVKPKGRQTGELRRLASQAVHGVESGVPSRVLVAPWGEVKSSSGDFVLDEDAIRLVRESFEEQGTDIPIDYEHQTLGGDFSSPSGRAPAAGWIKSLEAVPELGLFAEVEWTDEAAQQLAAKEYRYFSPVVMVRREDRRMVSLHSAALTNKPAIVGMPPIVNRDSPADAPEAPLEALRCRLEADTGADLNEMLRIACRHIDELSGRLREKEAEDRVRLALRAGKLTEAQRPWALRLAQSSPEEFSDWEKSAPTVVPLGLTEAPERSACMTTHKERAARDEFRRHPELRRFTDEESYVRCAMRENSASRS